MYSSRVETEKILLNNKLPIYTTVKLVDHFFAHIRFDFGRVHHNLHISTTTVVDVLGLKVDRGIICARVNSK